MTDPTGDRPTREEIERLLLLGEDAKAAPWSHNIRISPDNDSIDLALSLARRVLQLEEVAERLFARAEAAEARLRDVAKELISAWYHAKRSCIFERSCDIDTDLSKLKDTEKMWCTRFGLPLPEEEEDTDEETQEE